jgi:hypothetical protein
MIQTPQIAYQARDDTTPEAEVSVLAAIYKLCISSHERKEAAPESRPEDARKDQDARTYPHCT